MLTDRTNLMIGDLIWDSENNIYKIISIYADGLITGYNKDKDYCKFFSKNDSIYGIPLTEKVLSDNKIFVSDLYFLNSKNLCIRFYEDHISLLDSVSKVICNIKYAHELQHFLKFIYSNGL